MRFLGLALALAYASTAYAQEAVEIPFSPPANTVLDIQEARTRTSTSQRGPNDTGRVTATLEIDGGDAPFVARWTTTGVEANGQVIAQGSPGAAQLLIGIPMDLDLAADGSPSSVRNWSDLQQRLFRVLTEMTPEAERTDEWRRGNEAAQRIFAAMSASDAAGLLFQDVGIMALCQHTGLAVGSPLQSESVTPNPLGGSPIRTLLTYELTSVDRAAGVAHVHFRSEFDPESVSASMRELIDRIVRESGRTPTAEERASQQSMRIAQNARAECVVDLDTGIARSVVYDVAMEASADGQVDRRTDRRELTITRRR